MGIGGLVLMSASVGYLLIVVARYVKSRRRPVTLADTLLANVLQDIGQH
jgi:hypothetical protein